MSGKNNVNPDHYKVAGRDRPNETRRPGPRTNEAGRPLAKRATRGKRTAARGRRKAA